MSILENLVLLHFVIGLLHSLVIGGALGPFHTQVGSVHMVIVRGLFSGKFLEKI